MLDRNIYISTTCIGMTKNEIPNFDYNGSESIQLLNSLTSLLVEKSMFRIIDVPLLSGTNIIFGMSSIRRRNICDDLCITTLDVGYSLDEEDKKFCKFISEHSHDNESNLNIKEVIQRNNWIIALWNGKKHKSETYELIKYSNKLDKTILVINPFYPNTDIYFYNISEEDITERNPLLEAYFKTQLDNYEKN